MRKLTVLAMVATLAMSGSAFAVERHLTIAPNATFAAGIPTSTDNNDTCDIGVTPAATLLLPYFEVDVVSAQGVGQNTLFSITNTSRFPQIAHVTVWTDWSYPVLDFNIFLTGYDVQGISMYDVIVRGIVAPPSGTSSTDQTVSPVGSRSGTATGTTPPYALYTNPNFLGTAITTCSVLPGALPTSLIADVRSALTTGVFPTGGCTGSSANPRIGGTHANAIGYVTVDVSATCSTKLPTDSTYFTQEILFDNVLIGDYEDLSPNPATTNFASGAPMVHIRAIPEGGPAGSGPGTNLPFTFYDRYTVSPPTTQVGRAFDRRQPLPSTFAARFIQGGTSSFNTNYKIWREGNTSTATLALTCSAFGQNGILPITEIVRFDEHENPTTLSPSQICSPCGPSTVTFPETSSTPTSTNAGAGTPGYPPLSSSGDVGGWMYLNLANGSAVNLSAQRAGFGASLTSRTTTQNWVVVNLQLVPRFSVSFDAAWLGNGCTAGPPAGAIIAPATQRSATPSTIPAAGSLVCPPGIVCPAGTQPSTPNP